SSLTRDEDSSLFPLFPPCSTVFTLYFLMQRSNLVKPKARVQDSLKKAEGMGLGDYDLKTIEVIGELKLLSDFKLPLLSGKRDFHNKNIQEVLRSRVILRPQVDHELCTGCGPCVEQCPVSALSTSGQLPQVDSKLVCITCFCCQEICPEKVMTLK
ncbi:MAG TPA: 4Fe-4S binding protein, partial [Thermodesulfobacteriota bacterium]|nr:4Fe-4S binding protein [Thermodesulfobacteriota bacterium]